MADPRLKSSGLRESERRALREGLLAWYDEHHRDLPWRRSRDPYAIWVSEVMAQQTRIDTVIPYYQRFLARFPTVGALAAAEEDEVLGQWSGLGYYRRARLLHAGAQAVVREHGGEIPAEAAARRALPGVGRYTAGAIGSIAFGREEAVVDGNVARVLARIFRVDTPLGESRTDKRLWAIADELVRGPRPGDFNQAMMELGATVCTPRSAACLVCPLAETCAARAEGREHELPVPKKKKPPRAVSLVAVVARRGGSTWLERSGERLFGGLWMVPTAEVEEGASDATLAQTARELLRARGIRARLSSSRGDVRHVLSHRKLTVRVLSATHASGVETETLRCLNAAARAEVGVARLTEKILAVDRA